MAQQTIFISGITGCQGSAVAHHSLKKGWAVQGLARNPDGPAATKLQAQGVKLFRGDYDNTQALEQAIAGCTAVFIALVPKFDDLSAELRWAKAILAVAKTAGVETVVVSTGLGVENPEQLNGWNEGSIFAKFILSKKHIEEAVSGSGFEHWTILRPGFFMANFLEPKVGMYAGFRETGIWTTALLPTTRLPLVDDLDIGAFAVAAIDRPATFHGKKVAIGFDVRTPSEITKSLSEAAGKQLEASFFSEEELEVAKATNPIIAGYFAMRNMIALIDIDAVKSYGIPMGTFEEYLKRHDEEVKKTYG